MNVETVRAIRRFALPGAVLAVLALASAARGDVVANFNRRIVVADRPDAADSSRPILRWRNGETLSGELAGATGDQVLWRSPVFAEPLALRASRLMVLEIPGAGVETGEPFLVVLRNGDRLPGTPVSIDPDTVRVRSATHGEVRLRRGDVAALVRISGGSVILAGPHPAAPWRTKDDRNATARTTRSVWRTGPGGAPVMSSWNRTNHLPCRMPERVEVEIHLRSTASPRFRLDLNSSAGASPSLETWDDTVVLVHGARFVPVLALKAAERDVRLRLCWDRVARQSAVFSTEGEKLAELAEKDGPRRGLSDTGIFLRNMGLNLTLVSFRVREWNGSAPTPVKPGEPRVETVAGAVMRGEVLRADSEVVHLRPGSAGPLRAGFGEIDAVVFGPEAPPPPSSASHALIFADGGFLSGRLLGVEGAVVRTETAWSGGPLASRMDRVRVMHFDVPRSGDEPPEKPLAEMDRLVVGRTSLHGMPVGVGDAILRWLPTGGVRPVPLLPGGEDAEVVRAIPADAPVEKAAALFFIEGGDVLPGVLRGIDREFVHLRSSVAELSRLPATRCYAVQFAGPELSAKGFTDAGWRRVKGDEKNVALSEGKLTLNSGGAFGHPSLLQADEISFTLATAQGYGVLRLRLFADDIRSAGRGLPLLLMHSGNQFYCGIESESGGFDERGQFAVPYNKSVQVRVAFDERFIEVFANGVSVQRLAAPPEKRAGLGLVLELANIWGNGERQMSLSEFSLKPNPERTWFPPVDAEARLHALTVPRFRRENLPGHVLVAANGDLLRGGIEAATTDHFRFRVGLETLDVPRSRVVSAIWLRPPSVSKAAGPGEAGATGAPDPKATHWLVMRDGGRIGVSVEKFESGRIVGRAPLLGRCEVPMDRVRVIRFRRPEPTTAMTAFQSWRLEYSPDPVLPESGGQGSPLLGKDAASFKLPLLGGGEFELSRERGRVVVLDFWATWCGPCVKSLPEMIGAMEEFDPARVRLIGLNQGEAAPVVQRFLEQRGWKLAVALDAAQNVGRQFGVEGIPHTVIVGPDGKIGWVKTGYEPGGAREAAGAVRRMLEGSAAERKASPGK